MKHRCTVVSMIAAIAASVLAQPALASNWRYAGYALQGDTKQARFFENTSLARAADGTLQVRVETVPLERLIVYQASHNDELKALTRRRVDGGYVPNLLVLPQHRSLYPTASDFHRAVWHAVLMEATANTGDVVPSHEYLLQFDCAGKRLRLLESADFDDAGVRKPVGGGEWIDSGDVPGATGEPLAALFCAEGGPAPQ